MNPNGYTWGWSHSPVRDREASHPAFLEPVVQSTAGEHTRFDSAVAAPRNIRNPVERLGGDAAALRVGRVASVRFERQSLPRYFRRGLFRTPEDWKAHGPVFAFLGEVRFVSQWIHWVSDREKTIYILACYIKSNLLVIGM